ncbi:phosphatase PAP2 family protein [Niallia oryzisoli]|uniref:Phosphatase PAP2 family protein n=1 Tax=Niallia oryzisoli TaxID=1737571 RepID=A0ABZ2CFY9_9BACI
MNIKRGLIVFVIAIIASIYFVIVARSNEPTLLDQALSDSITEIFPEQTYSFFEVVTELGDKIGIGIVALIMLLLLSVKMRDYFGIGVLVFAVALGNEASKLIKELVGRERPATAIEVESLSFPSGHAMVGLILYMLAAYLLNKSIKTSRTKWLIGLIALIIILLIGLSRIVLQDHFPTDVLGGFSLGIVWTMLWISFYEWLYVRFPKKEANLLISSSDNVEKM